MESSTTISFRRVQLIGSNKYPFFKDKDIVYLKYFLNVYNPTIKGSASAGVDRDYSIMDVSLCVGYNNHNYYSSLFKKLNNITPLEFRNRCSLK